MKVNTHVSLSLSLVFAYVFDFYIFRFFVVVFILIFIELKYHPYLPFVCMMFHSSIVICLKIVRCFSS